MTGDFCIDAEGKFSAHKFVDYLQYDARTIMYDYSENYLETKPLLPEYYDEKKIKRAQQFFEENITAMMSNSMAGLIVLLSDPRGIKLLLATNKSSEPLTAYKRYRDTMKHMVSWYRGEFKPGSKLWKSLTTVRNMHNSALKLGLKKGLPGINQTEMSGTLYGFMGLALAKPKEFGLASASEEDLDALVHFWRVIGYLMGVDENLSICRASLDETKEICRAVTEHIAPYLCQKDPESTMLQFAALDGSYMVTPSVEPVVFMNFIYQLISTGDAEGKYLYPMNLKQKLQLTVLKTVLELCQYKFLRMLINSRLRYTIYLTEMYPEIIEHSIRDTDLLSLI